MKRAALIVAAVVIAAALALVATRPGAAPTSPNSPTSTPPATAAAVPARAPRISRADVDAQHDEVTAAERGRIGRTRLLDATLVTAAEAHGVSITAGAARANDRDPQQMVATPDDGMTVREIATAVSQICGELKDRCLARDYRFSIQTPTGQALLPARLIHPNTKDPR